MSTVIAQRDLRNRNAEIIDAVAAGESFVVTRHGEPVAELHPVALATRRTFVPKAEVVAMAGRSDRIDGEQFRRDLDRVVDQAT